MTDKTKLRTQAEARFAQMPETLAATTPEEIQKALHELRVHQIELEMQNEELRQAQADLDASRARYFDLYDLAPVGYCTLSEAGLILEANLTATTLLGVARRALVQQPLSRFIFKDDQNAYYLHRKQLLASGSPLSIDLRMVKADGTAFWAQLVAAVLQNDDGAPTCRVVLADITARKQAEERLRLHAQLLEGVQESVVASDLEGRILYWGRGAERLYGYKAEEVLGRPYRDFAGAIDPPDEDAFRKEILAKGSWQGEHRQKNRGGESFWTSTVISLFTDEQNRPAGYIGIDQDVTKRKLAERTLRESEERFRQVAETAKEWIWEMDADGVYTYSNPVVEQILGYPPEELVGKIHFHELFAPQVREEIRKDAAGRSARKEAFRKRVNPVVHKDGHIVILETTGVPILDPEGKLAGYRGADTDVTQRIRAEEALHGSETRYRTFINATSDLVFLKDEAFRYLISNRANSAFLGQSEADVTGRTDFDLMPREAAERCRTSDQEALRQGTSVVSEESAGGRVYQTVKFPVILPGGHVGVGGFIRDVTERKQAEDALQHSHERLALAQRAANAGMWEWDMLTATLNWTPEFFRLFGLDPATAKASFETWRGAIHPDDLEAAEKRIADSIRDHIPLENEYRIVRPSGEIRWIFAAGDTTYAADGTPLRMAGICIDNTERKRGADALRESEARSRSILNASPDGIVIIDLEGRACMVSPRAAAMFGRNPEEDLRGRPATDFLVPEDRERALANIVLLVQGTVLGPIEYRARRTDGSPFAVEVNSQVIRDVQDQPESLVLVIRDVTERKRTEEKLRDSERQFKLLFESMSSGFALHEIILDEAGAPCDYRFLQINPAFETLTGLKADALIGRTVRAVLPRTESVWIERYGRVALTGEPVTFENYSVELDRHYQVTAYRPQPGQFAVLVSDVTARKQAEKALHESEQRHRNYLAHSPYGIFVADEKGRLVQVNPAAGCITGYSEQELLSMTVPDLHGKDGREDAARHFQTVVREGKATGELRFRTKSGDIHWWLVSAVKISNTRFLGFCNDITDRKRAEEALRASQQITEGIIDAIPMRVFWKDKNLVLLGCNQAFARDAGFTDPKDLVGKDDFQMGWRKQAELYRADDRQVIQSGQPKLFIEEPQTTPDGKSLTLLTSKIPLRNAEGEITGVLGTYMDITEHKQAEEKLRATEMRLRDIAANIPGVVYQLQTGRTGSLEVPYMSSGCEALFERPLVGVDFTGLLFDQMHLGDRALFQHSLAKAAQRLERWNLDFRIATPEGNSKWLRGSANPRPTPQGGILWNGVLLDITPLKQAEEKEAATQALLRLVLDRVPAYICAKNLAGRFLLVNQKLADFYGRPIDAMTGSLHAELCEDPAELQAMLADDREVIESGQIKCIPEETMKNPDGSTTVLETYKIPFTVNNEPAVLVTATDITERKRAEKKILLESLLNKTIIDSIPGTFYMLDEAGNYVRWSKYQQDQIVGQPDERMRQTNALSTIHPNDRALIQARIENVLKNGVEEVVEGRVLLHGGPDSRWFLMTGRRMDVDGRPALIGIGIDITERKEAELQVAQQLDELRRWQAVTLGREGRVAELKREANALAVRLGQPPPYPSAEAP